jgi:predicted enzyme related to lactoylglutathione lyase
MDTPSTPREVFQVEIRTRDLKRAMSFYGAVFDWKIYPSAPEYALIDSGAMPVIALFETRDPRFPLGVANNVIVEDCQKEGDRAVKLGGSICVRKFVVPNQGAYVGTLDPWGNELFFWEPFTSGRPNLKGSKKNPVVLLEIATPDLDTATKYYSTLCGWSFWGVVFADNYAFAEGCGLQRGVGLISGAAARAIGTTDYVAVADLAKAVAKVREAGGRVVVEPAEFPGEGKFFVFEDTEGNRMGALERPPA